MYKQGRYSELKERMTNKMQFLKFEDCIDDADLFFIRKDSELDNLIKECAEEVAPLRIGVCCLTDPKQLEPSLNTLTDKLMVRYFTKQNKYLMHQYIADLCSGRMTTRLGADGTIWIDKGKKHKFDCVPADDVESMFKEMHPDMFYMFIMDNEDNRRDVYGLFLFDNKNATKVHNVSYPVESSLNRGEVPDVNLASVPCVGPAAFYALKELKYLT